MAYLVDGDRRHQIRLPESRRFASVTVMPGGQVLLWGGIDARGQVLDTGEWFEPATERFVRTGVLDLPARAGHTLTVLTDGQVLMTGGWSAQGVPATTTVLWQPLSRQSTDIAGAPAGSRLAAVAQLQADGSVLIKGGVDAYGQAAPSTLRFDPTAKVWSTTPSQAITNTAAMVTTFPEANTSAAPIEGPLVIRFATDVNVRQLNARTVTLLGPEGTVPVRVVGIEGGRLAFVQLPDDLYPGSRYTLFLQGLHTASGAAVPYTAVGFTTARIASTGVAIAGHGALPWPSIGTVDNATMAPPMYLMAGGGEAICSSREADQLCREHSFVHDGAWYPGKDNAPDATGGHWRLYQPHQGLPDTHALEATLAKGTTALIGQVRQIDEAPVANVEVSLGDIKAHTDAHGVFVLTGLPAGRQELFVDGRPASHGEVNYGRFLVGADIQAKSVRHMPFVMYLPRVLPRDVIALPSPTTSEVVLTHPDMPGLELHIPAGTVFKDREGHVLSHIAIVPTPVDHAPFPLPDNFPMYFTIQPGDASVEGLTPQAAKGIRVVYPNYAHAKPNTTGNFWVYGAQEGWRMYGGGHVTADAKHIAPDPGVSLVWAMGAGISSGNANPSNNRTLCNTAKSQPIDLQTGIFFHEWNDLSIQDIVPLTLTRAYNSADSNSHVFGVGGNANFGIHLYTSTANNFTTPELVLPCGEGVAFNVVSGSAASYPFTAGTVWEHTGTDSAFYGATLQWFHSSTAEYFYVTLKDGTQYFFQSEVPNQLIGITDRYGNQIQLTYNGGLVDQMTSPSGRSITFSYDSSNRIKNAVDNTGRTIGYTYNSAGSLATVTYPDQTTEQYTYTGNLMQTMQDRRGNVWVTNQYDTNNRVIKQTLADGTYYQFAYGTNATTVTDPNGHQEYVTFDPVSHYPSADTYAYGTSLAQTTTYVRESSGLIDSVTDALGRTTTYSYDPLGNVTQLTRLAGTSSAVSYNFTYTPNYSQPATVTDPLGHTTTLSYGSNGCLNQITDALSHSITVQCNAVGQPTTITDALSHTTTLTYQGYDLQSATDALSRTTTFEVDALGRRIAAQDPMGNVTLAQYDVDDRVTQVTDALNQTTQLSYDGNGNRLSVTLPSTAVIRDTYDTRNRPLTQTDALNQIQSWTYDGMGDVLTHTDRKQQVTMFSYDALNRATLVSYADGSGTQASYDAGNRLTQLLDTATGSLSWGYDGLNRMTSAVTPQATISYGYDAAGRRTSMTPAAQAIVNYVYDNANRLTSLTQGSEEVQFGYDAANRRTSLVLPNNISMAYGYDVANQLTGITYLSPANATMGTLVYGYDLDGHKNSKTGSFATDIPPTPTSQNGIFDLNNRQTSYNGGTLSYDANGNLTYDGTNTYVWNARNQLSQITVGGTVQASYTYDALGRRTAKAIGGTTPTQYLYDGANAVQETLGSAVNPILTGLGIDERFARNDVTGRTYFLTDALGSTIGLTDPTGAIQQEYSYDPYGNATQTNNSAGFTNPYQYTGREADGPGLYYYRARYYSPELGRFISEDPMGFAGGQLNFYAYVGDDPLMYRDPYGLWVINIGISGTLGFGWGITGGAGFVFDSSGNVGTYSYGGEGFAYGASMGVGGSFMGSLGSDTTTIDDFNGPFGNLSVPYFDGYFDPNNPNHVGAGSNYGGGESFFVGCTNTKVKEIGNLNNLDPLDYVAGKIFGGQWPGVPKWEN
ncbi:RHS repeat-associated core domain-containing protein [Rhodanobacter sp. C05]|uniref:RHS repeat-associated core domain-containing protein n=1 Tax=Rhodanobacter sp. C05 TaxID=1945855 RepID=UPI001C2C3053|nr:RHS repeat-associated core domain-containing protein [Rhodanobacter sp. C05]